MYVATSIRVQSSVDSKKCIFFHQKKKKKKKNEYLQILSIPKHELV